MREGRRTPVAAPVVNAAGVADEHTRASESGLAGVRVLQRSRDKNELVIRPDGRVLVVKDHDAGEPSVHELRAAALGVEKNFRMNGVSRGIYAGW